MNGYTIDPERSQVWVDGSSSVHPVRATATGLTGWVEIALSKDGSVAEGGGVDGEVRIEVERLRSGNPLVDRETRRRVDAKQFPEIVGRVIAARRTAGDRVAVEGEIDFRGETCRVEGELTLTAGEDGPVLEGSQRFDVRDLGLEPPRVAMLRVHPEVEVRIRLVIAPAG